MIDYSIVITTINIPTVLESIAANLDKFNRKKNVEAIIIGDRKTPKEAFDYVQSFQKNGFNFEYWSVEDQEKWLDPYPRLKNIIPYNSDNRRNIGFLMAYARNRNVIISMDDDNYPLPEEDYIKGFENVGVTDRYEMITTSSGWYNVCKLLDTNVDFEIYPRGFPYKYRLNGKEEVNFTEKKARLVVQGGLWKGDPDIDAVTRLTYPVKILNDKVENIVLDSTTNCPFNTQNTGILRDVIPAYYYVLMQETINGQRIDRYGDIWSGYFAKKIIDTVGDVVGFGNPLAFQKRNDHDLFKDLSEELPGMILTNKLVHIIRSINVEADNYFKATELFSQALIEEVMTTDIFNKQEVAYFKKICNNIDIWLDTCKQLEKK